MAAVDPVRWAILGTANIAAKVFLPALAEAGGGRPVVVGSRHSSAADAWAREYGVDRVADGYAAALEADDVDAVYVALPNSEHAQWAIAALEAGKAVLCEKPLSVDAEQAERVLLAARRSGVPLWEAFVFPFGAQFSHVERLLNRGAIGQLRQIESAYHFLVRDQHNIRFEQRLAGGALNDVGCYPVRLAQLLFGADPTRAEAGARWSPGGGVDTDIVGWLEYPDARRLTFSAGFTRPLDTFTRLLGADGEIRLTNPFHPRMTDTVEQWRGGTLVDTWQVVDAAPFTPAIRHIHDVLRSGDTACHTAVQESLSTARTLDLLHSRLRSADRYPVAHRGAPTGHRS